jgi:hypothetical protein
VPEILRTNLSSTILTLKGMGIKDPIEFDYMDAPETDKLVAGLRMLYLYGALDADGDITAVHIYIQIDMMRSSLACACSTSMAHLMRMGTSLRYIYI